MNSEIWTIVGGGSGGQTFAGHLAMLGKRIRLYSKSQAKIDAINATKVITLDGAIKGAGRIEFATTDIREALADATHVVMILPSNWHYETTRAMVPHLRDGQYVLVLPEASCGAIAFRKALADFGCTAKLVVGAGSTLPYATRAISPGVCHVCGEKAKVGIAALPASDNERLRDVFCTAFPAFHIMQNVIATSIDNINLLVHPAPVLLNAARIEAEPRQTYEYYHDGFTESVGKLLERIDAERIAVAKALGVEQRTLKREFSEMYKTGTDEMPLHEIIRNNPGYRGISNAKSIRERYFTEDVPYSQVAVSALGKIAGVPTPCIDAVCILAKGILGDELDEGRTVDNLGLSGMSKDEFLKFING